MRRKDKDDAAEAMEAEESEESAEMALAAAQVSDAAGTEKRPSDRHRLTRSGTPRAPVSSHRSNVVERAPTMLSATKGRAKGKSPFDSWKMACSRAAIVSNLSLKQEKSEHPLS